MNWRWLHYGYTPDNPDAIENRFPILKKLKVPLLAVLVILVVVFIIIVYGTTKL